MDSLNTDCLIEVIKLLNLKDQTAVYQVNSSLRVAVSTVWLIELKHININFLEQHLSSEELNSILDTVQDAVETLKLRFLNKENYEVLKTFRLKRVRDFRFTLNKPYFLQDDDLKDLIEVLPNLRSFSPHGNLTGLYMDGWPLLKDLNLSFCFKLEMQHFETILRHLELEKLKLNIFPNNNQFEQIDLAEAQVENLQYLEVNTFEFYHFVMKPMQSLKEIIITNRYNPKQIFALLLSTWRAKEILSIQTANVDSILVNCLEVHLNIQQLSIVNDGNPFPSSIISSLRQLTDLRKLCFKSCLIKSNEFIDLLKNIPQLDEISFETCQFDAVNIYLKVDEICANRGKQLRLNMFENILMDGPDEPIWYRGVAQQPICVDVVGDRNLLALSHFKGEHLCYEPLYISFR